LVGFKWIAGVIDEAGPDHFLFAAEESHGYLVGQYARDKDAVVAAMLLSELCASVKAEGKSLHEKLQALWWQHGFHAERLLNQQMAGSEGMARMKNLMAKFRSDPPPTLAGLAVRQIRDYLNDTRRVIGHGVQPLDGPKADLIILDLEAEGNYVAVRPSGTEPKVKFYMFTYVAPEQLSDLGLAETEMSQRLEALEADLKAFADTV
jgi:phosphoglucomutase/phosphomannomutase